MRRTQQKTVPNQMSVLISAQSAVVREVTHALEIAVGDLAHVLDMSQNSIEHGGAGDGSIDADTWTRSRDLKDAATRFLREAASCAFRDGKPAKPEAVLPGQEWTYQSGDRIICATIASVQEHAKYSLESGCGFIRVRFEGDEHGGIVPVAEDGLPIAMRFVSGPIRVAVSPKKRGKK